MGTCLNTCFLVWHCINSICQIRQYNPSLRLLTCLTCYDVVRDAYNLLTCDFGIYPLSVTKYTAHYSQRKLDRYGPQIQQFSSAGLLGYDFWFLSHTYLTVFAHNKISWISYAKLKINDKKNEMWFQFDYGSVRWVNVR